MDDPNDIEPAGPPSGRHAPPRTAALIVDPGPGSMKALRDVFSAAGYAVAVAETFTAAELAIQAGDVDLIVCETCFPDDGAIAFMHELRERDATALVPFVFQIGRASCRERV